MALPRRIDARFLQPACGTGNFLAEILDRMGLVTGEGFAVDASVLEANASRYHGKAPAELDWSDRQRKTVWSLAISETRR